MKLFETKIKDEDLEEICKVLKKGKLGFGSNVNLFESKFKNFSNKKYNIATNSASAAAFMIFAFLKEKYGVCDVYTTSLGFTSPAWAAKHFKHNLIFIDVQDDLQFSCTHYKKIRDTLSSNNVSVVMPVLYGGVSKINNFNLLGDEILVVDSAHCVTPTISSDFIFFSFHPYKPICTSDGGMVSTDNKEANLFFRNYRNFGRTMNSNSYTIEKDGFKFYMNNLNATIGLTQIKRYEENLKIRKENYNLLQNKYDLIPHDKKSSYYFATTLIGEANNIINNIGISRNYPMLHKMEYYNCSHTLHNLENLHDKILNLPLWRTFE